MALIHSRGWPWFDFWPGAFTCNRSLAAANGKKSPVRMETHAPLICGAGPILGNSGKGKDAPRSVEVAFTIMGSLSSNTAIFPALALKGLNLSAQL